MAAESMGDARRQHSRRRAWIIRVVLVLVAALIVLAVIRLFARIDWSAVGAALGNLTWWQPFVLLAVLLVRQVCNGLPLAFYVPGVSVVRATINDLGASLIAIIAPPPSDFALRVAMFSSWNVPVAIGAAGAVMNMLTFYFVRFIAPLAGFVLVIVASHPVGFRWLDVISVVLGVALLAVVVVVLRTDQLARKVGATGARLARRFGRPAEPQAWAALCSEFRRDIGPRFGRGFPRSVLGLGGMLAAELAMLTLCIRFVGVDASSVSLLDIAVAYLFAYPLTIFPLSGLGPFDALVVASLVAAGGGAIEEPVIGALIVWRVFTMAGPAALGAGAIAWWRHSQRGRSGSRSVG